MIVVVEPEVRVVQTCESYLMSSKGYTTIGFSNTGVSNTSGYASKDEYHHLEDDVFYI